MYRRIILIAGAVLLAFGATALAAETFEVDVTHSDVSFKVRHFVSKSSGRFDDFSGTFVVDREDMTKTTIEFAVKMASIDTDNDSRDDHLKSADFFDVEKYPDMTFKSTGITKTGESSYDVTGQFNLHGVTKEIVIPVEVLGFHDDEKGSQAGFEMDFVINRKDFGIIWNKALDAGGFVLGEDVEINITLETHSSKEE